MKEQGADILIVLPDLRLGGGQRVLLALSRQFLTMGYDVAIVTLVHDGELIQELPEGAAYRTLNKRLPPAPILAMTSLVGLIRLFRAARPEMILSTMTGTNLLTALAHRISRGRGRLVLREAVSARNQQRSVIRRLMGRLYRFADALIAVSHSVATDLEKLGLRSSPIYVIPNPVDEERLRSLASAQRGPLRREPYVVCVARLALQKDHATLLRAYAISRLRVTHRLVLVGDGEEREALVRLSRELEIDSRVDFAGAQRNPYPSIARADLLVLPSRWEGYPNVLLEALALGVPVVATDCPGGSKELLDNGRFGRLVAPGDHIALARAMEAELQTPKRDTSALLRHHAPAAVADRYVAVLAGIAADVEP